MSYQIKETPTPLLRQRRIVARKKRELEQLKEDYARIKELNDRTIELKMRQVRLNRLFREIEEIKEQTALRVRKLQRHPITKPKTDEQLRIETIKRSKSLGTEFSKVNRFLIHAFNREKKRKTNEISSTEKRIRYGNDISRLNFRATLQQKRRERAVLKAYHELTDPSFTDMPKAEKLRCRLFYGNTQSYINMLKTLTQNRPGNRHSLVHELVKKSVDEVTEQKSIDEYSVDTVVEDNVKAEEKPIVVNESYMKLTMFTLACKNCETFQQATDTDMGESNLCNVPSNMLVSSYQVNDVERVDSSDCFADAGSNEILSTMNIYEQEVDQFDRKPEQTKEEEKLKEQEKENQKVEKIEEQKQQLQEEKHHEEACQLDEAPQVCQLQDIELEEKVEEEQQQHQSTEQAAKDKAECVPPKTPFAMKIPDAEMFWPPKLSATSSSFILNNTFPTLGRKRRPAPPIPKKTNITATISKEAMDVAKMCAPHIRNVVKESLYSTKELRAIFEHEN